MWEIMTLTVVCGLSWIVVYLWGHKEGYADGKKDTLEIGLKKLTALNSVTVDNFCNTCSHKYKAADTPKKRKNRRKL